MRIGTGRNSHVHLLDNFSAYCRIATQNKERVLAFPFGEGVDSMESKELLRIREWTRGLFRAITLRPKVWGLTGKVDKSSNDILEMTACAAIIMGIVFPDEIPKLFPSARIKGTDLGNNSTEIEATLFSLLPKSANSILAYANALRDGLRTSGTGKTSNMPEAYQSVKIGRNDSCPCRSGLKYKKCCGK
jgi:uncharacterized protein YecA (UPF0149 family)